MNSKLKENWKKNETRYVMIGIWNTFFAIAIFLLIHKFLAETLTLTETLTVAFGFGVVQSYVCQKKYVWRTSERVLSEFPKFLLISTLQYIANVVLLKIFTTRFKLKAVPSQIFITAALILTTYAILKLWVFKDEISNQEHVNNDHGDKSMGNL